MPALSIATLLLTVYNNRSLITRNNMGQCLGHWSFAGGLSLTCVWSVIVRYANSAFFPSGVGKWVVIHTRATYGCMAAGQIREQGLRLRYTPACLFRIVPLQLQYAACGAKLQWAKPIERGRWAARLTFCRTMTPLLFNPDHSVCQFK